MDNSTHGEEAGIFSAVAIKDKKMQDSRILKKKKSEVKPKMVVSSKSTMKKEPAMKKMKKYPHHKELRQYQRARTFSNNPIKI